MPRLFLTKLAALLAVSVSIATNAFAVDGEILITQAKALAGHVTPGDDPEFPVTLSLAGSYKLGSNLVPGSSHNGIVAAAPDISIDLNGFVLSGGPSGGASNSPIGIVDLGDRLTVKNGTVGAFRIAGIRAKERVYLIVENTRIINGHGEGIDAQNGGASRIQNNTIASNLGSGIVCGTSCLIEGNIVSGNGKDGIFLLSGTVLGNAIMTNNNYGILTPTDGHITVGIGNNTIGGNGVGPVRGHFGDLFPNYCRPTSC